MKKIAIFVEGETEYDFLKRLLIEFIGVGNISIVANKMFGGNKNSGIPRRLILLPNSPSNRVDYQASFFISGNHENVTSDIRELKDSLVLQGFSKIIGLRDLRGEKEGRKLTQRDLPDVERLHRLVEQLSQPIPTKIITAVMEIETWFLAEINHYVRLDKKLTKEFITSKTAELGFDPYFDDLTLRLEPKEDLNNLYGLVKKVYSKKETVRIKTINCLDLDHLRNTVGQKISQVKDLFDNIEEFVGKA